MSQGTGDDVGAAACPRVAMSKQQMEHEDLGRLVPAFQLIIILHK